MNLIKALLITGTLFVSQAGYAADNMPTKTGITDHGYVYQQGFIPRQILKLNLNETALLIVDPQNDFMSEQSPIWPLVGPSITENHMVEHLTQLIDAAEKNKMFVFYSPHMYTKNDIKDWRSLNGIDKIMFEQKMFIEGTNGHDYLPALRPSKNTIILSPHKGLSNFWSGDIAIQMRQRGIKTIIIAGMAANMCVDAHSRDAVENGFDLIVVADAVAAAGKLANEAGLINYEFLAHEVLTTNQVLDKIEKAK